MVGNAKEVEEPATAEGGAKEKAETESPTVPAWLDAAFMQEALRRGGHADALVDDIQIRYAITPGNNYCSIIYRVSLNLRGRDEPKVLLVKGLPAGENWAKMVKENHFFTKESIVFSRVLPAMDALLAEAAPGRFQPFAARCLHHGEQPSPFIVLQDLGPEGFRMSDRRKGMDLPHALVALRALGRFHAASAALWRRRPDLFEGLISPWDEETAAENSEDFKKSIESLGKTISNWTDLPGDYGKKIVGISAYLVEKLQIINRERPGKFNVLIHGDFWLNNMLFSYEEDTVSDVRFLDFQMSHIGNPANDLIVFKYSSLQEEVFDNHWDILLESYCDSLTETLRILGEEIVTLQDIRNDLIEAGTTCFLAAFMWLPIVKREEGVYDVEQAAANNDWSGDLHDTPSFRHWMKKLLPEFDQKGLFDELLSL